MSQTEEIAILQAAVPLYVRLRGLQNARTAAEDMKIAVETAVVIHQEVKKQLAELEFGTQGKLNGVK